MTTGPLNPPEPSGDKMQWAERVLSDILQLMDVPAKLELKDAPPSPMDKGVPGISVAVFPTGDVPGVPTGKRSPFSDALQFLANKIVNRTGTDKRWIQVGVGGHPEPRAAQAPKKAPEGAPPAPPAAEGETRRAPPAASAPAAPAQSRPERPARPARSASGSASADEATLAVSPDEALSALGETLARKSATLGRYYGVVGLSVEDRARLLQAARPVSGATVKVEGEGKARRLVFVPDTPVPMPKRAFPDFDDEDELED